MYRDDSLEARVAQARTDQRRLINQWRAHGYTCTDTYLLLEVEGVASRNDGPRP